MDTFERSTSTRESHALIGSDKVEGTEVRNRKGEHLGSIERIMIDKISGKVAYAVMAFGGFLGIGHQHHALPWGVLKYDTNQEAYVIDLDKETLEGAPRYSGEYAELEDRVWGEKVHDYYRIPPYWI